MIRISAFKWVPPFAQGHVRDLRVRWALEEAGLPYETRLLSFGDGDKPGYRELQPFGQVPIYQEGELTLFETGSIVFHIAERSEALLPRDPDARARAVTWMFAALNSIEPFAMQIPIIDIFNKDEEWAKLRRPGAIEFVAKRLRGLARDLGDREWLEDTGFSAGDLLMVTVLRILEDDAVMDEFPTLVAYMERGKARPAFHRALEAQLQDFKDNALPK